MELMVVIAIVGILSAVSWGILAGARKSSDAKNACEQVASMINKTRNYALSGKTFKNGAVVVVPTVFTATVSGQTVTITNDKSVSPETFSIPNSVTCGASLSFAFSAPYGTCSGCGSPSTPINCSVSGGATRTVTVTPNSAVCN